MTSATAIEADCNSVAHDAVLALQLATGKNVSLLPDAISTVSAAAVAAASGGGGGGKHLPSSLLDRLALMPHASIGRLFNVSAGYTLPEYVDEDYTMAMYLRNALLVLTLLALVALALKLCCAHGYWHRAARKYNEKVALDYRMQVAQLRAEQRRQQHSDDDDDDAADDTPLEK